MIDQEVPRDSDTSPEATWPSDEWPSLEYNDDLAWTALAEPDLWRCIARAQDSFLEFARAAEYERFRVLPTYEAIAIKAFIASSASSLVGEHIFLTNVYTNGKTITAILAGDSRGRPELKEGQETTFPIEKVSDWFLVRAGKGLGGFTIPYVWSQLSEDEQQLYRNEPPFVWFWHRGSKSAEDELIALPRCVQCHKRNVGYPDDFEQPCGICRSGSWRCNCPKCGAPLIRNEKLPKLCARCF